MREKESYSSQRAFRRSKSGERGKEVPGPQLGGCFLHLSGLRWGVGSIRTRKGEVPSVNEKKGGTDIRSLVGTVTRQEKGRRATAKFPNETPVMSRAT